MENQQKPPDAPKVIQFPSDRDTEQAPESVEAAPEERLDKLAEGTGGCVPSAETAEVAKALDIPDVTEIVTSDAKRQSVTNSVTVGKRVVERLILVEWLSLSDGERIRRGLPRTQRDLAARMGVSEYMLSKWKQEKDIRVMLAERLRGRMIERAPNIIEHLAEKAVGKTEKGCNEAARMILDGALPPAKAGTEVSVNLNLGDVLRSDLEMPAALPEWAKAMEGEVVSKEPETD